MHPALPPSSIHSEMRTPLLPLLGILALFAASVHAQIFQHFFGGQQFEAQEQEAPPSGDGKWFEARVEAATCTQYLCPRTLSCVSSPAHCPCPFPHQIRCAYPDSTTDKMDTGGHMCVQEATCDNINQARRLGQGFKMSSLKRV